MPARCRIFSVLLCEMGLVSAVRDCKQKMLYGTSAAFTPRSRWSQRIGRGKTCDRTEMQVRAKRPCPCGKEPFRPPSIVSLLKVPWCSAGLLPKLCRMCSGLTSAVPMYPMDTALGRRWSKPELKSLTLLFFWFSFFFGAQKETWQVLRNLIPNEITGQHNLHDFLTK